MTPTQEENGFSKLGAGSRTKKSGGPKAGYLSRYVHLLRLVVPSLLLVALAWGFFSPIPVDLLDLPEWFLRLDLVLVWLAFGIAIVVWFRNPGRTLWLLVGSLGVFGLIQFASAIHAGVALAGPMLTFALYGVPFAVIATLVLASPSPDLVRVFLWAVLGLALLAVPVSLLQAPFASHPDEVEGTFLGLEIGAHLNGVIAGTVAVWILARADTFKYTPLAVPFLLVALVSDTKQILLLLPVVLLFTPAVNIRMWLLRLIFPLMGTVLAIWAPAIPGVIPDDYSYALKEVGTLREGVSSATGSDPAETGVGSNSSATGSDPAETGVGSNESRKVIGFERTLDRLTMSPGNLLLGLGPAQSVSYAALLSDDSRGQTLGASLGLDTPQVLEEDFGVWDGGGSFSSEFSSVIGLIGDFGILGLVTFLVAVGSIMMMVLGCSGGNRNSVWGLGLLYLGLGVLYIWWEQPVFTLYVGMLMGLTFALDRLGVPGSLDKSLLRSLTGGQRNEEHSLQDPA